MTPDRVEAAIAGWKFLLLGELFQTRFLNLTCEITLETSANLPLKTSMEAVGLCKSPGCKKNSLFWLGKKKKKDQARNILLKIFWLAHILDTVYVGSFSFVNLLYFPKHRAKLYRAPSSSSGTTAWALYQWHFSHTIRNLLNSCPASGLPKAISRQRQTMQCWGISSPALHSMGSLASVGCLWPLSAISHPTLQGSAENPAACHALWAMRCVPSPSGGGKDKWLTIC